jgi:hypothetical protein
MTLNLFRGIDTYSLHTMICAAQKDSESAANAMQEWKRRFGKPYPYHPSYENEIFGGCNDSKNT